MTYIGIDLSLTRSALVILHPGGRQLATYQTKGKRDATLAERAARLSDIADWAFDHIGARGPNLWAIEGPSMNSRNPGSAHDRSGLWWLLVDRVTTSGLGFPLVVPPAVRAKYATGKGNAGKDEVLAAVIRRYDYAPIQNNDEADAFVIAAIAARLAGDPIEESLPATHLAALKTLGD